MTKHEATLKIHSELLLSALVDTNNALIKFEVLSNEKDVHKNTKLGMKKSMRECKQIIDRFHRFWGDNGKRIIESQVINDSSTLQIQEITHNTIELPKEYRDKVEVFINEQIKEYKSKCLQEPKI